MNSLFSEFDISMMELALEAAKAAALDGNVPVGALISRHGEIIAIAHNERDSSRDPTAHAEMLAIRKAAEVLKTWHLEGCTLYVTLEPCPMCAGALINSRISHLVFGACQDKFGAIMSKMKLFSYNWNHIPTVSYGLLAEESSTLLQDFFQKRREEKKKLGGPAKRREAALDKWYLRYLANNSERDGEN